jgi:hypothetical protein
MKKLVVGLLACVAVLAVTSALVLAAAQKVELVACPINYPAPDSLPPGHGFVIFNNPAGENHNLEMTISLKGLEPNTEYDLYLFVDGAWFNGAKAGTVTTNRKGNANFHVNALLDEGEYVLGLDVTKKDSFSDVFETPGIHEGQGTLMIFE